MKILTARSTRKIVQICLLLKLEGVREECKQYNKKFENILISQR